MAGPTRTDRVEDTVRGFGADDASDGDGTPQDCLNALSDMALTSRHTRWNVVGPDFIAVHTMLDPQVDAVGPMIDSTAEQIATPGGSRSGTLSALVAARAWEDYSVGRTDAIAYMGGLDVAYAGIIEAHRQAIEATDETYLVAEDMLINQAGQLEPASGALIANGARTQRGAASKAQARPVSWPGQRRLVGRLRSFVGQREFLGRGPSQPVAGRQ
jgi:starvation-inducible DNA-binding protein